MLRRAPVFALCLAASTSACLGSGGSPSGTPGSTFSFSWRIDGRDPRANPTACRDAGVQFLQLVLVNPNDVTRERLRVQWDCSLGTYRSPTPELPAGAWAFYIEAVATDGSRLSVAPGRRDATGAVVPAPEPITVPSGGHLDLDRGNTTDTTLPGVPTNFATGTGPLQVALQWQTRAGMGDCAAAGVAKLRWQLVAPNGVVVEDHATLEACAQYATIRWDRTLYDEYSLVVRGYGADESLTHEGRCAGLRSGRDAAARAGYACAVPFRIAGSP